MSSGEQSNPGASLREDRLDKSFDKLQKGLSSYCEAEPGRKWVAAKQAPFSNQDAARRRPALTGLDGAHIIGAWMESETTAR